MRIRKQALGDRNIVGAKIEQQRKSINMKQKDLLTQLQIKGIDLTRPVFQSLKANCAMLQISSLRLCGSSRRNSQLDVGNRLITAQKINLMRKGGQLCPPFHIILQFL